MSNRILNLIAGDYNARQLKKIQPLVTQINHLYDHMHDMTDKEVQAKTSEFKQRYQAGESLDTMLAEAFAVVKQAAKRMTESHHTASIKGQVQIWNMVHYDVQLVGGIVLHQGNIAEMRTGEGKTLVATLAVYLNALTGKGVHVVTVNDYLASRDGEWMGELYKWLGLTVGIVTKHTSNATRRQQYEADITYVENSELGFDYLRDNLTKSMGERAMLRRPLHYAIVDEVDSILIDEARTPMIISQPSEEATEKYAYYAKLVALLTPSKGKKKISKGFLQEILNEDKKQKSGEEEDLSGDYYIDEKLKTVTLSSAGISKLEEMLKVENLYRDIGYGEIHHIENALKAHAVYHLDKEYLVRDGEVLIVDDNTGRVMPGRRYSQGLHQAIEAKEQVEVQRESKTLATITYQHFFGLYEKIAGMTGTATTEAEEFENIYKLEVITIPTNRDTIRVDKNDAVYFNQNAKWEAVVDHIKFYHDIGVPILIGTSSIQTSELVSNILRQINYPHTVLNAKFHEQEALIISNAGKKGSLVVATNMAGRGTDIKLADSLLTDLAINYAKYIEKKIQKSEAIACSIYSEREYHLFVEGLKNHFGVTDTELPNALQGKHHHSIASLNVSISFSFNSKKKSNEEYFVEIKFSPIEGESSSSRLQQGTETEYRDIHFGLYILGTEKHDSRRIDNQLRGRSGRQGDPGISQFFVAFDDEIMRKMGGEKIQTVARMMMKQEELEKTVFTQSQFTSSIARAQKQMEARHFSTRKHLFEYDSVINKQRTRTYEKRDEILRQVENGKSMIESSQNTESEIRNQKSEIISTNVLDEIQIFIKEIVEQTITLHLGLPEVIETLSQITGISFLEDEFAGLKSEDRRKKFIDIISNGFQEKIIGYDRQQVISYLNNVYLRVIDKNWMEHIDEMQNLREKVGLYGYAQIDPLVVYKKESFEKFQSLLTMIKQETLSQAMKTDYHQALQTSTQAQIQINEQSNEVQVINLLKELTKGVDVKQLNQFLQSKNSAPLIRGDAAGRGIGVATDDIEVFEMDENTNTSLPQKNNNRIDPKHLRPNDKVNVKRNTGKIEYEVKWKKIEQAVKKGEGTIF